MKLCVDGVFYSREPLDFKKILEEIVEILGEDVKVLSLEFPEIAAIVEDAYYYRCGFMLDKELEEEIEVEPILTYLKLGKWIPLSNEVVDILPELVGTLLLLSGRVIKTISSKTRKPTAEEVEKALSAIDLIL